MFFGKRKKTSRNLSHFENENTFRKRTTFENESKKNHIWKWKHLPKKNLILRMEAHSKMHFENENIFLEKWKVINPFLRYLFHNLRNSRQDCAVFQIWGMYIMINKFMSIGLFPNLIWQKKMMSRCLATTASDPVNYINKYFFSAPNENIDKNKNGTFYIWTFQWDFFNKTFPMTF